jgi:prepilin-type N-terminal cleavage/methylation domain-containing protein
MKHTMSQRGFTIVEILVASFILVMGITMIAQVVSTVMKKNFMSLRHTQAVNLAQNKIEELLNEGYASTDMVQGSYENEMNPVDETGDTTGVFYQSWSVEDVNPIERAKLITSRVEWDDADRVRQSVYLTGVSIDESN